MKRQIDRRNFLKAAGLAAPLAGALPAMAQRKRNIKIGHTGITWVQPPQSRPPVAGGAPPAGRGRGSGGPPRVVPAYIETIFKDVSGLGFYGLELFTFQVQGMEAAGGLAPLIEKYNLPLISAYGGPNLMDAEKRKDNISQSMEWARLHKKYGGKVVTIGPNGVRRDAYDFKEHKDDIVTTLNEFGKALTDIGLTGCLHQHNGYLHRIARRNLRCDGVRRYALCEVRARYRTTSERRVRSGSSRKRFPAHREPYALEGLQRRRIFRRVLSARTGESEYPGDPGHDGWPNSGRHDHGGARRYPA